MNVNLQCPIQEQSLQISSYIVPILAIKVIVACYCVKKCEFNNQ